MQINVDLLIVQIQWFHMGFKNVENFGFRFSPIFIFVKSFN